MACHEKTVTGIDFAEDSSQRIKQVQSELFRMFLEDI